MPDRILITGGAGFIGANLIRYLLDNTDYSITTIDRLDHAGRFDRLEELWKKHGDRLRISWWDLRSTTPLPVDGKFSYIIHLAAASHVVRSVQDPLSFVNDNVLGTAHLLEWARKHQPGVKLLYFSTDEIFGPAPNGESFDEYSSAMPNNPYAASKAAAEALIPAWANTYNMPLVVSHCTNIFGKNQADEKFIPLVRDKVQRDALVQIHARGGVPSSRYYVYVDNIATAIMTILEKGGIWSGPGTGKYNISGEKEYSNLYVAEQIAAHYGKELRYELVEFVPDRPRHDQRYAINSSRLEALGWKPHVDFETGLRLTLSETP